MLRLVLSLLVFVVFAPLTFAQDGSGLSNENPGDQPGSGLTQDLGGSPSSESNNSSTQSSETSSLGRKKELSDKELLEALTMKFPSADIVQLETLLKEKSPEIVRLVTEFVIHKK